MSQPLDRIAATMVDAIAGAVDGAEAGAPIMLPRGADPFAGAERPLLLAATRWTAVSPGGVVLGGTPEALATVLGFELPARPEVSSENADQARRATDEPIGEDGADAPEADAEPEPEAPVKAEDDDQPAAEGEAPPADDDVPAPARRWSDRAADAARQPAADASDGLIRALATLAGLPHGAAATQSVLAETDGMVTTAVGPLPDAVVVPIRRDGAEVRLVVVVSGIISARVAAAALEVGSASGPGAAPVEDDDAAAENEADADVAEGSAGSAIFAAAALGDVPLELSAELGTARMPLSSVLALREGAVIDLREAVDAPVALVAGTTTVASGELELDEAGSLVLHVTSIPGRPDLSAGPSLVVDPDDGPAPMADAGAASDAAAAPGEPGSPDAPAA
ncbi:MAG: FliM/FliN family flagellar motor switch protein [Solirubrobacteraceae bacterium]|nr:FliM/FliN family flagellar motor switch protein [Solirubrobacteraceae bacterium]